ncbi:hypothetical protein AB3X26_10920 [Raoultella planticola]|uniref:hypothetical protein n=1 Tax=Raoultella planticola TaxID=575 RepID=UPI00349F38C9
MTDITELAQSMSIERIKQIALGGTPTMGEKERLAITALYFSEQLKIATDAFQAAGLAQLAAEEALEKAQLRIDEMESDEVRQRLANAEYQLYMAELAKHNLKASRKAQFRKRRAAEKRIAELESRTYTAAAADVLAERQRQVTAEGWTAERDDSYQNSELADAAACYAIHAHNQGFSTPAHWPWSPTWWKQTNSRRDLVKAGALILAEIERIDRAAGIKVEVE